MSVQADVGCLAVEHTSSSPQAQCVNAVLSLRHQFLCHVYAVQTDPIRSLVLDSDESVMVDITYIMTQVL